MSYLDDEITAENIVSYINAGIELQEVVEHLLGQEYTFMAVPSRGAIPFIEMASGYWQAKKKKENNLKDILKVYGDFAKSPFVGEIYLPYTADISDDYKTISSETIRMYWTQVLAAIVRNDTEDAHYKFYKYISENVCRKSIGIREDRKYGDKFIFIDTVVSGKAICEIITAFEKVGLNQNHFIIIIDQNGEGLRPEYKTQIDLYEKKGRLTKIFVNNLFTEDKGPSVHGLWCVTFPDFMEIALEDINQFGQSGIIGAGMCYHEVAVRDDGSNVLITRACSKMHTMLMLGTYIGLKDDLLHEVLRPHVEDYKEFISKNKLYRDEVTLEIANPRLKKDIPILKNLDSSRSHALRVRLDKDDAFKIIRNFKSTL